MSEDTTKSPWPLQPDRLTKETWLKAVGDFVHDHLDALATAPAHGFIGAAGQAIAEEVSRPIPEAPAPGGLGPLLALVDRAAQASLTTPGPGYLAYVPGGGIYSAALGEFIASTFNRFTGMAAPSPALARLEADVLRWLATEFGFGESARGLLTTGGSLANLSAIITARHHHFGDSGDFRRATAYVSDQVHHSVLKSCMLAGIPSKNVRRVATDEAFRLDVAALSAQVSADRAAGMTPFLVVASAGTTNTGAIDPLPDVAAIASTESLWMHVDGAYGGAFVLEPEGRRRLAGIHRADSITFDPHKGLFLPYGTGCLLVRDGRKLAAAHTADAVYLQDFDRWDRSGEVPSPSDYGPELSRAFRGLRLWLPLMLHGARAFRETLAEKLALTEVAHRGLLALADQGHPLEVVTPPQLTIIPFRLRRAPEEALAGWNARNRAFLDRINGAGRVYLSSTTLPTRDGPAFTLRICVLCHRTHAANISACLEDVASALIGG